MSNLNESEQDFVHSIRNKFLKRSPILFQSAVINCWITITKYLSYQYGVTQVNPSVAVHLRNSNKQHMIPVKFYINNTPFVGNQMFKILVKFSKANNRYRGFCEVTPKHSSFRSFWMTLDAKTWNWSVLRWPHKSRCNYCLLCEI